MRFLRQKNIHRKRSILGAVLFALAIFIFMALQYKGGDGVEAASFMRNSYGQCEGRSLEREFYDCLERVAGEANDRFPFTTNLAGLAILQEEGADGNWHDFLHYVAAYHYRDTQDVAIVLSECTPVFFSACYHGAVSGYMRYSGLSLENEAALTDFMGAACISLEGDSLTKSQCVHGIGHGLMLLTAGELPQSLALCDTLSEYTESCYAGVFMENFPGSSTAPHPSKYISDTNLLYPCDIVEQRHAPTCYSFLTSYLSYLAEFDPVRTIEMCTVYPVEYRYYCYEAIGTGYGGSIRAMEQKESVCATIPTEQGRRECTRGIVYSFADRFSGTAEIGKVTEFCSVSIFSDYCYEQAAYMLRLWEPDVTVRRSMCDSIPIQSARSLCEN
jgi:hypothetical protein